MTYTPRLGDAAIDLSRCLNTTYGDNEFRSENFKKFYNNSLKILAKNKEKVSVGRRRLIISRIKRAGDSRLDKHKRREDLLLASNLLLKEHIRSVQFDNPVN